MKLSLVFKRVSLAATVCCLPALAVAENGVKEVGSAMLGKVGKAVTGTVQGVGDTVQGIGEAISSDKSVAEMQREIDQNANKTLNRLLAVSKSARILNEKAYGYAVFDTRKFSFLLTTGQGAGVAVDRKTGARTYMNMLTGGAGVGMGMQFFQLVFFFEDKESLRRFVDYGWEANAAAAAVFGEDSLQGAARFVEGMAAYQLNESGIMAAANITGTKYWKSTKLNEKK